jgi:uncharacterized repeat protein (TIGR01451 family)
MKVWTIFASLLLAVGVALLWPTPILAQEPLFCSTPNSAIPDAVGNQSGVLNDTLTITTTGVITDLNVSLSALHSYVGDLVFTLSHLETGASATLIDRPGVPPSTFGCTRDDIAATLDDEAASPAEDECAKPIAIAGVFTPSASLSIFDAEDIVGTWRLTVSDNSDQDIGTLQQWCLIPSPQTDLAVSKSATPTSPNPNDPLLYTVTVSNNGPNNASGVVISDTLPINVTFVSAEASQGNFDDLSGLWQVGSVAVGESVTLTLTTTVNPDTLGQTIINMASLSALDQIEAISDNNSDTVTATVPLADLSLTKQANQTVVRENDSLRYTLTVANNGPDGATGVVISDTLPLSLTFVVSSSTQGEYDNLSGLWTVGNLLNNQSATLILTATVNEGLVGQTITNTAVISALDQFDPNETNNSDEAAVRVSSADLGVTKTVTPENPGENDPLFYTIGVINNGPDGATGVVISDTLPLSLTLALSNTTQGNYDALSGLWDVGKLLPSRSATLTLMTTVLTGTAGQTITNTALIFDSEQSDPNSENNFSTAVITVTNADLAVSKTVNQPRPSEGDVIAYVVTLTNNGPNDTTGVAVSDALPAGLTFTEADSSQGNYDSTRGAWDVGSLAASASATLTLTATVNSGVAGQAITNMAVISASDQSDADLTNNSASAGIFITSADLFITKTASQSLLNQNDTFTYTITIANSGPDEATGVVISDALPISLTLVSSSTSRGSYDSNTGTWQVGTLGITDTASLNLIALVNAGVAGQSINNVAEISVVDQVDPDPADNIATAVITVTNADLALSKVVDNPTPTEGDTIIYTVSVNNNGPDEAIGVVISETLPLSLTLVISNTSQGSYNSSGGAWSVGNLAASASATLTLAATVNAGTVGQSITNTAEIGAAEVGDANSANNRAEATINVLGADLEVNKEVTQTPAEGSSSLTYTVTIVNRGPLTATSVVMSDKLATGLNFVSVVPNSQCAQVAGTITCTLAALSNNATATVTIVVTTALTGTISNSATVTAAAADPDPVNNSASVETPVNTSPTQQLYLPVVVKE